MNDNLFDPRFGKRPALFAGRDDVLRDIRAALYDPEEQERVTILSGIKGSGKSAILAEVRSEAGKGGFVFTEPLRDGEIPEALSSGSGNGAAMVYIIDDAKMDMPGLNDFLTDFSQRVHAGKDIRLILAGLPHDIEEILKEDKFSYLRRAGRISLGNLHTDEVLALFTEAFEELNTESGHEEKTDQTRESVLRRASDATDGYPYMVQLVGYYLSKEKNLDDKSVDKAIFLAKIELYKNVHGPITGGLSSKDRMFLWAMSQDEGRSEFGEIAKRMDVSTGYASKYRERLINAGVIYSSGYGELAFTLPFMKEYIEKEFIERLGGEGGKRRL